MSFGLRAFDAHVTWDAGRLDGYPDEAVDDARVMLARPEPESVTPTGPWYDRGTPEGAFLTLRKLWPHWEVTGDPPVLPELPDELDVPAEEPIPRPA